MDHDESECLHKEPCPACGSRNNLGRYSDGHGFCFGCHHWEPGDESKVNQPARSTTMSDKELLPVGEFQSWDSRGLTAETASKWGMSRTELNDKPVRVFNYRNLEGKLVAQKVRTKGKDFHVRGDLKAGGLYGQHLWRDKGKKVVITEGEMDAMSVSQVQGHKWPVVSVPTGSAGAKKSLQNSLEWLAQFEEVILMFDQDDAGRAAVEACAPLFKPGQCKVAKLPLKDANDMLKEGRGKEIIDAIWGAKVYRPDGIIGGDELFDIVMEDADDEIGFLYPWQGLNEKTLGARRGELVTFTAGSGIGKTAVLREIIYHMLTHQEAVGVLMLEENVKRTGRGIMGLAVDKPIYLSREGVTDDEMLEAYEKTLGTGRLFLYDHFGSTASDNLLDKIRYLAKGCGVGWIVLDHISIVVSGQESDNERKMIDKLMTDLKSLAMECNIGIMVVSHLKRPEGKGHEEGTKTSLSHLRGSHSIAQLSDFVIGMERNQQSEELKDFTTLRVLKNRWTGETGIAGWLRYDHNTGRLIELYDDPSTDGGIPHDDNNPFGTEPGRQSDDISKGEAPF